VTLPFCNIRNISRVCLDLTICDGRYMPKAVLIEIGFYLFLVSITKVVHRMQLACETSYGKG